MRIVGIEGSAKSVTQVVCVMGGSGESRTGVYYREESGTERKEEEGEGDKRETS